MGPCTTMLRLAGRGRPLGIGVARTAAATAMAMVLVIDDPASVIMASEV